MCVVYGFCILITDLNCRKLNETKTGQTIAIIIAIAFLFVTTFINLASAQVFTMPLNIVKTGRRTLVRYQACLPVFHAAPCVAEI
jgi:hypothetical protein